MVQKNVWYLKKEYEKTAGSASEGADRDQGWRRIRRIYGLDEYIFNGNPASHISISGYGKNVRFLENNIKQHVLSSNSCCLLLKNGGINENNDSV